MPTKLTLHFSTAYLSYFPSEEEAEIHAVGQLLSCLKAKLGIESAQGKSNSREQIQLLTLIPMRDYASDFLVSDKVNMNAFLTDLYGLQKSFTEALQP